MNGFVKRTSEKGGECKSKGCDAYGKHRGWLKNETQPRTTFT